MRITDHYFLAYVFGSQERWQGWWDTPNQSAAVLATLLPLLLAQVLWSAGRECLKRPGRWTVLAVGFAGLTVMLWHLALTYSRGGWVAAAVGISMLALGCRKARMPVLAVASIFAIILMVMPSGLERISTATEWQEDKSVSHRFLIWRGALQMLAEHPWRGVGLGRFGDEFMAWYQPLTMTTGHITAVNDYLTVAAERGVFFLAVFLFMAFPPVWLVWKWGSKLQSLAYVSLAASVGAFFVSGAFSSLIFKPNVAWSGWILWGCLLISAFVVVSQQANNKRVTGTWSALRSLVVAALSSCLLAVFCLLAGHWFCRELPIRIQSSTAFDGAEGLFLEPRAGKPKGTVLFFTDFSELPDEKSRQLWRPLAERGLRIIVFPQSANSFDALAAGRNQFLAAQSFVQGAPLLLAGHREGGVLALAMAAESPASNILSVATWGMPAHGPFKDFSAETYLQSVQCPVWLVHGESDVIVPALNAERLALAPHPQNVIRHLILLPKKASLSDTSAVSAWIKVIEQALMTSP
ncbi:hypothetical protein BH11VER1_BH11VER1_34680 [soil metagenome]